MRVAVADRGRLGIDHGVRRHVGDGDGERHGDAVALRANDLPDALLSSPRGVETVTGPIPAQLRSINCLPGAAGRRPRPRP